MFVHTLLCCVHPVCALGVRTLVVVAVSTPRLDEADTVERETQLLDAVCAVYSVFLEGQDRKRDTCHQCVDISLACQTCSGI